MVRGGGTIGIWESGSGQGYVSWCSNSRVMFKEVARKVQRGRSVRLRNLCAVSLILRLQGAGASAQTRNTCSPWSLQQNWERKKTGLTILPLPCNSFVSPNSALSPNSCIIFFGLGLTDTSCYTQGLFCKKQKHGLSDLSQATRQLFLIWSCNLAIFNPAILIFFILQSCSD